MIDGVNLADPVVWFILAVLFWGIWKTKKFTIKAEMDNIIQVAAYVIFFFGLWQIWEAFNGRLDWGVDLAYPLLFAGLALRKNYIK